MRRKSVVTVVVALLASLGSGARAEFPFLADANRCGGAQTVLTASRSAAGAELSSFDGTTDRTIAIGLTVGNDCATSNVSFRRVGTDLRST